MRKIYVYTYNFWCMLILKKTSVYVHIQTLLWGIPYILWTYIFMNSSAADVSTDCSRYLLVGYRNLLPNKVNKTQPYLCCQLQSSGCCWQGWWMPAVEKRETFRTTQGVTVCMILSHYCMDFGCTGVTGICIAYTHMHTDTCMLSNTANAWLQQNQATSCLCFQS